MDTKLLIQAVTKFISGLLLVGILLFLPSGTFSYWQAWLLMGILFVPMFIAGLVMLRKSPDLLRRRLNMKEEQDEQKMVILSSGLMFLAAFIVAGLCKRAGWLMLPAWVSWTAAVIFWPDIYCSLKCFGKMYGCPAPLRYRRIRRSWIPGCTE